VKYDDLFTLLRQNGWIEIRQKGSHRIMRNSSGTEDIAVPYHGSKEVKKGILQAILKKRELKRQSDENNGIIEDRKPCRGKKGETSNYHDCY